MLTAKEVAQQIIAANNGNFQKSERFAHEVLAEVAAMNWANSVVSCNTPAELAVVKESLIETAAECDRREASKMGMKGTWGEDAKNHKRRLAALIARMS